MTETLVIMDYNNDRTDTHIDISSDGLKKISVIYIDVVSGDEIATVVFTDGTTRRIDSSNSRCVGFEDDSYILYGKDSEGETVDRLDEFNKRTSSYWRWWDD